MTEPLRELRDTEQEQDQTRDGRHGHRKDRDFLMLRLLRGCFASLLFFDVFLGASLLGFGFVASIGHRWLELNGVRTLQLEGGSEVTRWAGRAKKEGSNHNEYAQHANAMPATAAWVGGRMRRCRCVATRFVAEH